MENTEPPSKSSKQDSQRIYVSSHSVISGNQMVIRGTDTFMLKSDKTDPQNYVRSLIKKYDEAARVQQILNTLCQMTIILGGFLVTIIGIIPELPRLLAAIIGALITLATTLAHFYKFRERSYVLHSSAEKMALEYNRFSTNRGDYKNLTTTESRQLLLDRVEALIEKQTQQAIALDQEKPKDK